jgi:raffinose/stachyose/melibiose transport system substrate-binding protein
MMRHTKSRLVFGLFAAGYVFALVWVFTRSTPLAPARPVTVRIAHWQIEKGPPDGFDAVIRRYEELNPRVHVEQVAVPGPVYRLWLRSNLGGNMGTDLVEFGYFIGGVNDIPVRYFEPLTRLMGQPNPYNRGTPLERVPWRLTFADGLYFEITQSPEIGQIYAATLSQGSMRLFCNRELLEKITGRPAAAPRTMADFRAICRATADYARRTGAVVHPLAGSLSNGQWLIDFTMAGSVSGMNLDLDREGYLARKPRQAMTDYLQGRWTYRRPELRAALALSRELAMQMKSGFAQLSRDDAVQEFMRGEALFIFTGTYDATSLKKLAPFTVEAMRFPQPQKDDPVIGPFVRGPFQDGTIATGMEIYLNKDSRHKDEAIDFLRFLTSVEGGRLFQDNSGWLSSVRGVPIPPELEVNRPTGDGFKTGIQYIGVGPNSTMKFWQHMHLLVGPQSSVDRFVDAIEADMPAAVTADLRLDVSGNVNAVRTVDSEVVALSALNRLRPSDKDLAQRQQTLAGSQTLSEADGYEAAWVLARHAHQP